MDLGAFFVRCAILNVIEVVLVSLHTHLAIGVLLVRDGLEQGHIMPVLNIVINLNCLLKIFVILSFSSFLDSLEIMHHELLLSLVDTRTVAVWRFHVKPVDIVLLL